MMLNDSNLVSMQQHAINLTCDQLFNIWSSPSIIASIGGLRTYSFHCEYPSIIAG